MLGSAALALGPFVGPAVLLVLLLAALLGTVHGALGGGAGLERQVPLGVTVAEHLPHVARALEPHGFHRVPAWWLDTLCAWLRSGLRQLVLRVGRRGGKSSTLCLLAVTFALFGEFRIPLGDVGVVAIVSVSRDEAAGRLRTIAAMLRALGMASRPGKTSDTIELVGRPIVFRTFTASVSGVSGFTCVLALCDEVAKWRDSDTGSNPATEVLASLRPTMATQPEARMVLSSSPLSVLDAHHDAFSAGDTDFQKVVHAPTWVANPSLTEADTHRLEPDERLWRREYSAIPDAEEASAFSPELVAACFQRLDLGDFARARPTLVLDPSSLRGDAFVSALASWCLPRPRPRLRWEKGAGGSDVLVLDAHGNVIVEPGPALRPTLRVGGWRAWEGKLVGQVSMRSIVDELAEVAHTEGAERAVSDQREEAALAGLFSHHGLPFTSIAWTAPRKEEAVLVLRRLMAERALSIEPNERCRRQLLEFRARYTKAGTLTYGGRGAHDDYAAVLVTTAMAHVDGLIPRSPEAYEASRTEWLASEDA